MKLHQLLMVATLITTLFCGSVVAQNQDGRLFGNGRFLRRLRDDITGKKPAPKPKAATKNKSSKADPRAKSPTPATRSTKGARVPTPASRPGATPTPATRPTPSTSARDDDARAAKVSSKKPTIGFGMLVEDRNEQYVVTKIDTKGNAYEAGIRKGDTVIAAGGVDLTSMEEFNEITDILGNGDQLEIEIARRGQKKKKVLVQFGEAPKEGEVAPVKTSAQNDYSFVPKRDDTPRTGMRSVLDSPQSKSQAANTQYQAQLTIEQQRTQIEQMHREIERLRQSTALKGPALSGPGQ